MRGLISIDKQNEPMQEVQNEDTQEQEICEETVSTQKTEEKKSKKKNKHAEELAELTAQKDEITDKFLRLNAEFDNFRKRSQKEKENIYGDAQASTIAKCIDVLDNLERAVQMGDGDELSKGVQMIIAQFKEVLQKMGVEEVDPQGMPFNPDLHNAVSHIDDENLGENTVAQVFQKGYVLGERVVRFAMVQVAN